MSTYADIVDAVEQLSPDEKQALVDLLRRRIAAENRRRIVQDVAEARQEHARGETAPASVDDIMN